MDSGINGAESQSPMDNFESVDVCPVPSSPRGMFRQDLLISSYRHERPTHFRRTPVSGQASRSKM